MMKMTKKQIDETLDKLREQGVTYWTTDDAYENIVEYGTVQARTTNLSIIGENRLERIIWIGKSLINIVKLGRRLQTDNPFPVTMRVIPNGVYCGDTCWFDDSNSKHCKLFGRGLLRDGNKDLRCEECLKKQIEWEGK
jgi:hypothetical protein